MLNRTLAASVLPRSGRLRAVLPSLAKVGLSLATARRRSLLVQERVDRARARHYERHGYGRHS
jgi:hypothetical protein